MFIFEDPPIHTAHRGILSRIFTPRKMNALEPFVRALCAEVLDQLVGADRLDFVGDLGARMPMRVIGALLGIPVQDQEDVRQHKDDTLRREPGQPGEFSEDQFADAGFFAEYIDWRTDNPSDDLMTSLIRAEFEDETGTVRRLTRDELLIFVNVLATAGRDDQPRDRPHRRLFAEHPDQRRELVDNRALIPNAVEEILRVQPPALQACRYVTHDVEFHGQTVPEGSTLMVLMASANPDDRPPARRRRLRHPPRDRPPPHVRPRHPLLPGSSARPARSAGRHRRDPQPVPRVGGRLGQRPPRQLAGAGLGVPARDLPTKT